MKKLLIPNERTHRGVEEVEHKTRGEQKMERHHDKHHQTGRFRRVGTNLRPNLIKSEHMKKMLGSWILDPILTLQL